MTELNEGPLTALGNALGAITRMKTAIGSYRDGTAMYLEYKKWAGAPKAITDISYVQKFARGAGIDDKIIKDTAAEWKKKNGISAKDVKASVGSAKNKTPSPITDAQIVDFFRSLHKNVRVAIEASTDNESGLGDKFDNDLENILNAGKKYGLKPETITRLVSTTEMDALMANSSALKQLAIIGYLALRY